jgi:hypothetical protein
MNFVNVNLPRWKNRWKYISWLFLFNKITGGDPLHFIPNKDYFVSKLKKKI